MSVRLAKRLVMRTAPRLAGSMGLNWSLLRSLTRPQWLYSPGVKIPTYPLTFTTPVGVTAEDVALCGRLIAAYRKATTTDPVSAQGLDGLWANLIEQHYGRLRSALDGTNPTLLATTLSSMFRESFMLGITTANLPIHVKSRIDTRAWSLKYLDQLVSLAEFLGVVRTESPEQGVAGYALKDGADELVEKIARAIDTGIGFPQVGAPYGIKVDGSLITIEAPEHIYVALRLDRAIRTHLDEATASRPNIVEIGAGFGGTAHWLLRIRKVVGSYTIIDLPLMNVMQGYFLSKVFGASEVAFYGEPHTDGQGRKTIAVLPTHAIDCMTERNIDVLLNENSMPEMPEAVVTNYVTWAKSTVRGIFFSYNQEAYSPVNNVPQVLVPEIIGLVGGFKLLTRNLSWIRRGYVEEVYRTNPS